MTNAHSIDTPVSKQEKKFKTKLTKPDFIKRAKSTHGDKFDYKDVSFDGALSKVKITCKECSTVFYPTVSAHMRGGNCPTCSRKQKIYCTNEDFKGKANKRHEGFYTYEKTDYVDSVTEVEINCPVHGLFFQRPKNHLKGSGCPDCGIDKAKRANDKNKTPFSEFVKKANNKHDNKYEYDEISYNGIRNTVRIKCKQHNWFEKRGLSHIAGEGCQECAAGRLSPREIITKAKSAHGETYGYEQVVSNAALSNKIRITCKEHSTFELAVKRHITGEGCPTCAAAIKKAKKALTLRDSKNLKLSKEEKEKNRVARLVVRRDNFIKQATEVHDGRYAYEKVVLNTGDTHAKIHCEKHGLFKQNILRHLSGRGCPQCGADESCGWSRSSYVDMCKARGNGTASLYVVRMTSKSESFIKIGITHKTVKERFSGNDKVPYAIDSLYIIEGSAGYIFDLEKKLHRLVSKYNYKPNQKFGGHTECFTTIKPIEKLLKELSNTDQLQLIA